jgi:hypothetical protein
MLLSGLLLLVAGCGTSVDLSFRLNRPPTLLTQASVDLRATGGVTAHVIDEGGLCGAVDAATEADAGATAGQVFKLPQGSKRAFLVQLPIQLGDDYVTLIAVVQPYERKGSRAVGFDGPAYVLVLAGQIGQSLAAGDLAGITGSVSVDESGRSGKIDATLVRLRPRPAPSATARPRQSTTARPSPSVTPSLPVYRPAPSDVRLVGKFRCVPGQGSA